MGKPKYFLESSKIAKTQVYPVTNAVVSYKLVADSAIYTRELKNKLKFINEDYELILQHKGDACEDIYFTIETACANEYKLYWAGKFKYFDVTDNKCNYLTVKPDEDSAYVCYKDIKDEEQSVYKVGEYVPVVGLIGSYQREDCTIRITEQVTQSTLFAYPNAIGSDAYPKCLSENAEGGDLEITPAEWHIKGREYRLFSKVTLNSGLLSITYELTTIYHREIFSIDKPDTTPPEPTGWAILSENDTRTLWFSDPIEEVGDYSHGRTLESFLTQLIENVECIDSVKSTFLNVNPENDRPNNEYYDYADNYLANLTVHQKSDIKRKDSSEFAKEKAWVAKIEDVLKDFGFLLNTKIGLDGSTLVIEHSSFFSNTVDWDLSDLSIDLETDSGGAGKVRSEEFKYADENSSAAFQAERIEYNCGTQRNTLQCVLFSTDLLFIENINNDQEVDEKGFVLISNKIYEGNRVVIEQNKYLSFPSLLENLHTTNRPYRSGVINGVQQDFNGWKPYVKGKPFKIDFCCGDVFDPNKLMRTKLGDGVVEEANHDLNSNYLEITNLYYE